MIVSPATFSDLNAVGVLIAESAMHAPSSPHHETEMTRESFGLAQDYVANRIDNGDIALKLEVGERLAACGVIRPRVLVRSSHVGELLILVHPGARRRGVGQTLMSHMMIAARARSALRKLSVRVNEDDQAFLSLLGGQEGWTMERLEHNALRIDAVDVAVQVWAHELP